MARYQKYTVTTMTANQFVIELAAFVAANGWTIDFDGVYSTSYRRLHFHQGAAHFEVVSNSALGMLMYGCTGYDAGQAPSLQPGVTAGKSFAVLANTNYWLISVQGAIYVCVLSTTSYYWAHWLCFFTVQEKIGSWSDGFGLSAGANSSLFDSNWYSSPAYGQIYLNGAWSATVLANGIVGNIVTSDLATHVPNSYNAGLVPMPILLMLCPAADSSKRVPLGYAPGIYRTNGGNIYSVGEELVIGADTYLIVPSYYNKIGQVGYVDFLFKLGA